jgi:hypothetical protein
MVCVFKKKEWYALLFRGPVTHAPPHSLLLGSAEIFCSFPTPRLGCGVGGSPSRLSPLASVLRAPAGDPVYAPPSSLPPLLYRGSPACCPVWPGLGSAGAWWRPELAWKQVRFLELFGLKGKFGFLRLFTPRPLK